MVAATSEQYINHLLQAKTNNRCTAEAGIEPWWSPCPCPCPCHSGPTTSAGIETGCETPTTSSTSHPYHTVYINMHNLFLQYLIIKPSKGDVKSI